MAKFTDFFPDAIIKDFDKVYGSTDKIMGEMTRAGAEVVAAQMSATVPNPGLRDGIRLSRTYRTPSDGGINTKVYITGYFPFSGNRTLFARRGKKGGKVYTTTKGVPKAFVAQMYEYGRSDGTFPKKPFMRKAFGQKKKIEKAMIEAQSKASGGLLDE